jgi:hypothetical protein
LELTARAVRSAGDRSIAAERAVAQKAKNTADRIGEWGGFPGRKEAFMQLIVEMHDMGASNGLMERATVCHSMDMGDTPYDPEFVKAFQAEFKAFQAEYLERREAKEAEEAPDLGKSSSGTAVDGTQAPAKTAAANKAKAKSKGRKSAPKVEQKICPTCEKSEAVGQFSAHRKACTAARAKDAVSAGIATNRDAVTKWLRSEGVKTKRETLQKAATQVAAAMRNLPKPKNTVKLPRGSVLSPSAI